MASNIARGESYLLDHILALGPASAHLPQGNPDHPDHDSSELGGQGSLASPLELIVSWGLATESFALQELRHLRSRADEGDARFSD